METDFLTEQNSWEEQAEYCRVS